MKRVSIGLDIGSTSIKGILFDITARTLITARSTELGACSPAPGGHNEQDALAIRDAAFAIISELAAYATVSDYLVEGIGFTGQMHGGLVVNQNLVPRTHFVSWQDKRGDETAPDGRTYVENLRDHLGEDPTGVGIHTGFLISTLDWLLNHDFAFRAGDKILGVYDWIASLFVGRAVTDVTSAAAWAMWDIVKRDWRHDLIASVGIPTDSLPEVAEPGSFVGNITKEMRFTLGLPATTRIFASIGDTQASFIGSGCRANEILLNVGTGSQSMWFTPQPIATEATDIRYLRNGKFIVTSPTLAGGKAYQILADFYRDVICSIAGADISRHTIYEVMNRIVSDSLSVAEEAEEASSIGFTPLFAGSRFRPKTERASITNISSSNFTVSNITLALLRGMINEIADPYFIRREALNGSLNHVRLVGAGNAMRKNRALAVIASERFGLPIRVSEFEEEAATGAALLAAELT